MSAAFEYQPASSDCGAIGGSRFFSFLIQLKTKHKKLHWDLKTEGGGGGGGHSNLIVQLQISGTEHWQATSFFDKITKWSHKETNCTCSLTHRRRITHICKILICYIIIYIFYSRIMILSCTTTTFWHIASSSSWRPHADIWWSNHTAANRWAEPGVTCLTPWGDKDFFYFYEGLTWRTIDAASICSFNFILMALSYIFLSGEADFSQSKMKIWNFIIFWGFDSELEFEHSQARPFLILRFIQFARQVCLYLLSPLQPLWPP